MCYADSFLSEEAHAACLPSAGDARLLGWLADGGTAEGGGERKERKQPAFASHAWGTPFSEFRQGLQSWKETDFWIGTALHVGTDRSAPARVCLHAKTHIP